METEPDDRRREDSEAPEAEDRADLDALEPVDGDDLDEEAAPNLPPVVAVVITDGAPGLEATLESLLEQEYPSLSTLVVDRGAPEDPTGRVAAVYPHAFVRRLGRSRPYAEALNTAITSVEGATFLLVCRDDVVLEPGAVRVLVEEAFRNNAAIVGPKIVDVDRPEALVEVGLAIDRYGIAYTGIEPGELDQEQHDAVRDVFCVSDAVMLLRADLARELGGFDPRAEPAAADIDLCWRARLLGGRVVVAPDARARRPGSAGGRRAREMSARRDANRSRIRVLVKCTSLPVLLWVLPVAFLLDVGESVGLVATRRFARARALMAGWFSALADLRSTIATRRPVQSTRQVGERDVHAFMLRGSARVRTLLAVWLHERAHLDDVSTRTRRAVGSARATVRGAGGLVWIAVLVLVAFGSRNLITVRIPSIGGFEAWPGFHALASTYRATWRGTGLGSASPAASSFGMMTVATAILFGHAALARTLVIVGAIPLGGLGVYRGLRRASPSPWPAIAALVAYVANPLPRNMIGAGELGPLVCFALAPFVVTGLVYAVGETWTVQPVVGSWHWRRIALVGALLAVCIAFWPPALLLALLVGAAALVGAPLVGRTRSALWLAAAAVAATVAALVLLVPWPLALVHADGPSLGLLPRAPLALSEVLRFHTGAAGAGWLPYGLLVAAALPLITAAGNRLVWAGRGWLLAAGSFALAWLPGRLAPSLPVPLASGVLVPAALGLAVAFGLGVASFVEELRSVVFGWRQVAAAVAACGLLAPVPGLLGDAVGGSWRLPAGDWAQQLQWMQDQRSEGAFRILWIGDPSVLPLDGAVTHGVGFGLSRDGAPDARDLWPAPEGHAGTVVREAVGLLATGRTARVGHVLAPLGVRYIAIVDRTAPGVHRTRPLPAALGPSVTGQIDLTLHQTQPGLSLYENAAWVPIRAVVPRALPTGANATSAALAADLSGASALPVGGTPVGPGSLFLGEAHDSRWRATQSGRQLTDARAFGWANAYRLADRAAVQVTFAAGPARAIALVLQGLCWLAFAAFLGAPAARAWWRRRDRVASRRGRATRSGRGAPAREYERGRGERGRFVTGRRAPIAAVLVALLAVAIAVGDRSTPKVRAPAPNPSAASLSPAATRSAAWYCAGGPAAAGANSDRVTISNFGPSSVRVALDVLVPKRQLVERILTLAAHTNRTIAVASLSNAPGAAVVVQPFGADVVVAQGFSVGSDRFTPDDVAMAPCASRAAADWYFAAGSSIRGMQQSIAILNPFTVDAAVDVVAYTENGLRAPASLQGVVVGAESRVVLRLDRAVSEQHVVAVAVHASNGAAVVATQSLVQPISGRTQVAMSLGTLAPRLAWTFADNRSRAGVSQPLVLAVPGATDATVKIAVLANTTKVIAPRIVKVPATGTTLVDLGPIVPNGVAYGLSVTSSVPIVAETRAAFAQGNATGLVSEPGSPSAARTWVFASGPFTNLGGVVSYVAGASQYQLQVWMRPGASDAQISAVRELLRRDSHVKRFHEQSKDQALSVLRRIAVNDPVLAAHAVAADLPISFQVAVKASRFVSGVRLQYLGLAGVDHVATAKGQPPLGFGIDDLVLVERGPRRRARVGHVRRRRQGRCTAGACARRGVLQSERQRRPHHARAGRVGDRRPRDGPGLRRTFLGRPAGRDPRAGRPRVLNRTRPPVRCARGCAHRHRSDPGRHRGRDRVADAGPSRRRAGAPLRRDPPPIAPWRLRPARCAVARRGLLVRDV